MSLEETVRRSISRAGIVRVRNALILYCGHAVVPSPCWALAYLLREDVGRSYFFTGLGSLPILATLTACFVFMFKDPDRLQSEEFVLRQQELSLVEHKGHHPSQLPSEAADMEESTARPSTQIVEQR